MQKLVRSEINYLSFEGGGGAGNAYPGALVALEELAILRYDGQREKLDPAVSLDLAASPLGVDWQLRGQIEGVSGASAGAINALFLSLGYTPAEVEFILKHPDNDFNAFFDAIIPGLVPHVGGFRLESAPYDLAGFYEQFSETTAGTILNVLSGYQPFRFIQFREWESTLVGMYMGSQWTALLGLFAEFPEAAVQQVLSKLNTGEDAASLLFDFGIFPGMVARKFFARYVSLAVERILQDDPGYNLKDTPGGAYGPSLDVDATYGRSFYDSETKTDVRTSEITFRQHEQIFGTKLLVTGSNLETQKSHFFSADATPNFRIVDAVRISMSLPLFFKPMIIKDEADLKLVVNPGEPVGDHYLKGVWADGGLFNNIPVAAFDQIAGGPGHTLGLMVGLEERTEITNIFGFLGAYPLGLGVFGTGGSQVSATTSDTDRILVLDTKDAASGETIGLLDFSLEEKLQDSINAQSNKSVKDFFALRTTTSVTP